MESCGFQPRNVQPVVIYFTVNASASAKIMFFQVNYKILCGSRKILLQTREKIRQLEFGKTKIETFFGWILFEVCSLGHNKFMLSSHLKFA
jgi:hypothetical protein